MKKVVLFIFLLSSILKAQDSRPLFMTHYMPWYQAPSVHGYWGYHWTMNHYNPDKIFPSGNREIASQYYPVTGPYDSNDPLILEYQTLLMKISGIDGVLVDWYGTENFWDYGILNESTQSLFTAIQNANLSFAIVYEDQTIKHMVDNGHLTASEAIDHGKSVMNYMQNTWFNKTAYLKIDNRPVLLTFGPQYFKSSSDWITLFSNLVVKPQFFTLDNRLAPAASGAYPWPPMWKSAGGILSQSALTDYLNQFYQKAAAFPFLVTSVFPGFYDIYKEAGVGDGYGYLDRKNGATFKLTLQKALDSNPDVIQIVTWNDYGEGTIVEPTTLFGTQYLEIIRSTVDSISTNFEFEENDLQLPIQIYNARRKYSGNTEVNSLLDRITESIFAGDRNTSAALMDSFRIVTDVKNNTTAEPGSFSLSQNYPNPFNTSSIFEFCVPDNGLVKLTIYDIMGKETDTLLNEVRPAGNYSIQFNAENLPSGLYFYQLKSGKNVETRKMLLLK